MRNLTYLFLLLIGLLGPTTALSSPPKDSAALPSDHHHGDARANSHGSDKNLQQLSLIHPTPSVLDSNRAIRAGTKTVKIAIIIDDLGYNLERGTIAAEFPAPLTLAVIPHSPNGPALAEIGHQKGKEIMLHTPMSNLQQLPLDEGGLSEDMQQQLFIETLNRGLNSIPHVSGINNHMGSFLTQLEEPMGWLMEELAKEELFFIDSRTSPDSVAYRVALEHQVASRKRDVFLDNQRDEDYIAAQFAKLVKIARIRGNALAIGHPHPETLAVLTRVLPTLKQQGVEIISISEFLQQFPPPAPAAKFIGSNATSNTEAAYPALN